MKVCIIGCGASGLAMTKELLDGGHEPTCFEATNGIGGVFTYSYEGLLMTSSSHITAFSDFPPTCVPTIWTAKEYCDYLNDYAMQFDLMPHIQLNSRVMSVQRLHAGDPRGYWAVVVQNTREEQTCFFDNLVVSTGTNNVPKRWRYEGQESYQGQVLHSGDISVRFTLVIITEQALTLRCGQTWSQFDNSHVVCVGMGESGADVVLEIAKRPGANVALSVRRSPGWITPRYRGDLPADMMTNRLLWGLPRRMGGVLGSILAATDASFLDPVIRKVGNMNRTIQTSDFGPFGTFGTKTTSGVEAVVRHDVVEKPDIARLGPGRTVSFTDGSQFEADYVVQSTGYEAEFKYLRPSNTSDLKLEDGAIKADQEMEQVWADLKNVRRGLFKHAIHPRLGLRLMFQGYIRPGFGAIPPLAEMQARWFVAMLNGDAKEGLPSEEEMRDSIAEDAAGEEFMYGRGPGVRIAALVDHVVYFNDLAAKTGCLPPWRRLLFSDPLLLWKVFTGPHTATQFRLAGPGALPDMARKHIIAYPNPFWPLRKLAVISLGLWAATAALYVLLLPFPSTWFSALRNDFHPVGFGNSRKVYNNLARLRGVKGGEDYSAQAVRNHVEGEDPVVQRRQANLKQDRSR